MKNSHVLVNVGTTDARFVYPNVCFLVSNEEEWNILERNQETSANCMNQWRNLQNDIKFVRPLYVPYIYVSFFILLV